MAALLATLIFTGSAQAEPWRPVTQSCVSYATAGTTCKAIRSGDGAWQIAVAPGGRHAYGVAWTGTDSNGAPLPTGNSLLIFDRDPATGQLTQRGAGGCLSASGSNCAQARGLTQPTGIVVSADGNQVYVANNNPAASRPSTATPSMAISSRRTASTAA